MDILRQIEKDKQLAQKYLISGAQDKSIYAEAVGVVYTEGDPRDRALIDARRKVESESKVSPGQPYPWVIKTQLKYAIFTESAMGKLIWESESQIKRHWKRIVQLVAEVAVRLPRRRRSSGRKGTKQGQKQGKNRGQNKKNQAAEK